MMGFSTMLKWVEITLRSDIFIIASQCTQLIYVFNATNSAAEEIAKSGVSCQMPKFHFVETVKMLY